MRLINARVRDYRLHRDLAVVFDPRFTVIAGPNQSGKSTLAEALHRALFLPVRTGGELLKAMQSDPFQAEPEVELCFEAGGERWELRKRFAASRGSVSLRDGGGRSLQGDEAEEQLARLIGTAAVARSRAAAEQLKERWGHLWVWQGSASRNPLGAGLQAYDHDRLVERLQAGADLSVTSELDLAVLEDIQARWSRIHTAGGANRAPQVRRGSALQLARSATTAARQELAAIEALIAQKRDDEQAFQQAAAVLTRLGQELPLQRQQHRTLQQQLTRSVELEAQIASQQPLLDALLRDLSQHAQDLTQLQQEGQRLQALTAAQAPAAARLTGLQQQLPELEAGREQALARLEAQQRGGAEAAQAVRRIEDRLSRRRLLQEQQRIQAQLETLEQLRIGFRQLSRELEQLPPLDAAAVARLRQQEAAVQTAAVRAEALSAGIAVIRADQPLLLDGEPLAVGTTRLLSQPALLQVGEAVELRLLPGGGRGMAEAAQALDKARRDLEQALAGWGLPDVEAAATAERRRSELLTERQRLVEQASANGQDALLRQRLAAIARELEPLPGPDEGEEPAEADAAIAALEAALRQARADRDQAQVAEQALQRQLQQARQALDDQRQAIQALEQELRQQQNQLLEARTRRDALLQRHGSQEALAEAIRTLEQRREALQTTLTALRSELGRHDPDGLRAADRRLEQRIAELEQQEREAGEARIRAEERLHGDGQTDLQAELEQKQAELESRLREQERLEKEAAMLTLLRRLLEEEQNAMGSRYTAPMLSRITHYLAHVFPRQPDVRLAYDARAGFQGLQWRRGEEAAFDFAVLSTGAREQFAAAVRVSMAEVLAEAYDGSLPVLFDDAFANSDPERQAGIHRMLGEAAERGLQVILLSCDPERSATISGARLIRLGD